MTLRPRMIRLFLNLCAYAGMVDSPEMVRERSTSERRPRRKPGSKTGGGMTPEPKTAVAPVAPHSIEHPLIKGLIDTLPSNVAGSALSASTISATRPRR